MNRLKVKLKKLAGWGSRNTDRHCGIALFISTYYDKRIVTISWQLGTGSDCPFHQIISIHKAQAVKIIMIFEIKKIHVSSHHITSLSFLFKLACMIKYFHWHWNTLAWGQPNPTLASGWFHLPFIKQWFNMDCFPFRYRWGMQEGETSRLLVSFLFEGISLKCGMLTGWYGGITPCAE